MPEPAAVLTVTIERPRGLVVHPVLLDGVRHDNVDVRRDCSGEPVRHLIEFRTAERVVTCAGNVDDGVVECVGGALTEPDSVEPRAVRKQ